MIAFRKATDREADLLARVELLTAQLHALLRILRSVIGTKALPLTDEERRFIAEKAKTVGWRALVGTLCVVSIGTLRRWFRELVGRKGKAAQKKKRKAGRPPIAKRIRHLVVRMARSNPTWGYDCIAGALGNLGIAISGTTVGNILREQGVPTAPERQRRSFHWKAFLAVHWRALAGIDAFTVPVLTWVGWKTVYVFVAIHLATRRIHLAAVTMHPDSAVMQNVARSLAMDDGFLHRKGVTHLIHDGDGAFLQTGFVAVLEQRGVTSVRIPPRSPNCNAHAERVIQTIQRECTDRIAFVGDRGLRAALEIYVEHYHRRRNHQGIGNVIIDPGPEVGRTEGNIVERHRLGGLLTYYEREAVAA